MDYRAWYGLGQTYEMMRMPFYALYYYRKTTVLRPYDSRMWCALGSCYSEMDRVDDAIKCYERAACAGDRCVARRCCLGAALWCGVLSAVAFGLCFFAPLWKCPARESASERHSRAGRWRHASTVGLGSSCVTAADLCGLFVVGRSRSREGTATLKLALLYRKQDNAYQAARYYHKYVSEVADDSKEGTEDLARAMLFLAYFAKDTRRLDDAETYATPVAGMQWGVRAAIGGLHRWHTEPQTHRRTLTLNSLHRARLLGLSAR